MQLDSLHSLQDPSSSIHPTNKKNATSSTQESSSSCPVSSDLDCDSLVVVAFEPSLQPLVLDTFILSSTSSPCSPTPSSACSSTSSCSDISSASTLADLHSPLDRSPKNESSPFKTTTDPNVSSTDKDSSSLLFLSLQNDSEQPLDLPKQPCLPLHLHFHLQQQQQQQQQQQKQKEQEEHNKEEQMRLVPPTTTTSSSPALTPSSSPSPSSMTPTSEFASVAVCSAPSSPAPTFAPNPWLLNHCSNNNSNQCYPHHDHHPTNMATRENRQSEPEIDTDSVSITNCDRGSTNTNSSDTVESPLTAQHPHIIYSTVPTITTTQTASSLSLVSSTKSTRTSATSTAAASPTTSALEPQSETLDLDLDPTQALFSAQLDPLVLDNITNMTSVTSMAHDTLHLRGEIKFDDSQELRPQHGHWASSLREHNNHIDGTSDTPKEDGLRFKDHPIETIVRGMGRERKRSTNVAYEGASSDRKRRKNQPDWGLKQSTSTVTTTSTETAAHLLRFLERRLDQRCPNSTSSCTASKQPIKSLFKQKTSLDFDPLHLLHSWSSLSPQDVVVVQSTTTQLSPTPPSPTSSSASLPSRRRQFLGHRQPYHNNLDCRQQHESPEKCQCRKRGFAEAIELSRPLTMNADVASYHPNWIESIKKRKVHQNATKWTSALSPAPYVRLLTLRNFWEMMEPRQDLSWRTGNGTRFGQDESEEEGEEVDEMEADKAEMKSVQMETDSAERSILQRSARRKLQQPSFVRTVKLYPCPGHFLRGLWEEELRNQRVRQMIPDTVRKPIRGKIYHAKPIVNMIKQNKPSLLSLLTAESLSSSSNSAAGGMDDSAGESKNETCEATQGANSSTATTASTTELELSLKKKHRAAAIIRSHAITEGSDMSEYKPWKDGTVTPREGSLQALKSSRSNIMDPWPVEEAKSKDECMRVLHRMREQLNIVINLQIHLRSMMKTAPAQWSFLLSIRHPGQVSIELLLALYGPHFMQTSNFRAIEELLWGAKGHSQQAAPSIDAAASSSSPALVQT